MPRPEIFDLPPQEAINHFRSKGYHVGFDWRDTEAAEHLTSFTVAKAMRLDILEDIRGAVDEAIADGTTFHKFHDDLKPVLQKKGWWGIKEMIDPDSPTGETQTVQAGSPHRLKTIFDTNLRMSYAKGRWERIERIADRAPWLRYVATLDSRTRPEHRAWHGTVLRYDDPFWESHYPPCGWFCRCTVIQLSDDDLEDFGFEPSPAPPAGWDKKREWHNKRSGEIIQVPIGIDPGFQHNVGLIGRVQGPKKVLDEKIGAAPPKLASAAKVPEIDDWVSQGRPIRKQIMTHAGSVDDLEFSSRFRSRLGDIMQSERGAGTVPAVISHAGGEGHALSAKLTIIATEKLPAEWVKAGNKFPLMSHGFSQRGEYSVPDDESIASRITIDMDPGTPLHEYMHHLQLAIPQLDELFIKLHRRRTAGHPRVSVNPNALDEIGRRDDYVIAYAGREYGEIETPLEVLPMAVQQLFYPVLGTDYLIDMVRDDPEMLDFIIGVLMYYNP